MERIYRDSVHNIIRVNTDEREGKLVVALIDTPEFQRLRRVRQLGLAYFAYQSAEHSRFTHSLGTYHLAGRMIAKLRTKYQIPSEVQTAIRISALLHDIGHGPFSHVIEGILGFHHEDFTVEAVLSQETAVGKALRAYSEDLPRMIADVIRGDFKPQALSQLVSSQLDVDRMDYLLRDSLMTGAKYGVYDLEWIIKSIEIDDAEDRLYVSAPGLYAVEDYLQARYYMYRQVYFHRTLRSAEAVLRVLLHRALDLFAEESDSVWCAAGTPMERILRGEKLSLVEHLGLDDTDVMYSIKRWEHSTDRILSDLAGRFLDRRLFKAFDLDMPGDERPDFIDESREIVANAGFDPKYYFVEDEAGSAPYSFYSGGVEAKGSIFVESGFSRPDIREISSVSAAIRGLQEGYRIHRICFPAELKDEISRLYHRS